MNIPTFAAAISLIVLLTAILFLGRLYLIHSLPRLKILTKHDGIKDGRALKIGNDFDYFFKFIAGELVGSEKCYDPPASKNIFGIHKTSEDAQHIGICTKVVKLDSGIETGAKGMGGV